MFKFMKSSSDTTNRVAYEVIEGEHADAFAVTHVSYKPTPGEDGWNIIVKAPIVINTAKDWDTNSSTCASGKGHLRTILRHEYGHVLGLGHSDLSSACMYYAVARGEIKNLTNDDISGAKSIYGDLTKTLNENAKQNNLKVEDIDEIEEVCVLYPYYTPVELANNSSNIVVGTVEGIESGYFSNDSVYSKVNISVNDNLKGTVDNTTISIPMFGGVKDGTCYMYDSAPTYTVGEEVVLYLNDLDVEEDDWYIPVNYDAFLDLSKTAKSKSVDKQAIIEQVKEDIEEAKAVNTVEEGVIVGKPVEDIMLDWE